jgi:hypothetical protein
MDEKPKIRVLFPPAAPAPAREPEPEPEPVREAPKPKVKPLFTPTNNIPEKPVAAGPTVLTLPGVKIRQRIEVSPDELRAKYPDASSEAAVFEAAHQQILVINLEDATSAELLSMGLREQERFAGVSDRMLKLTTSQDLDTINAKLREMGELFKSVNFDLSPQQSGWFSHPKVNFDEARKLARGKVEEILRAAGALRDRLPSLRVLDGQVDQVESGINDSLREVETALVVVRFIADRTAREQSETLKRRADSLNLTRVTARQGLLQIKMVRDHLRHLTETVYMALVNMIPAWCGNCANFLSAARPGDDPSKVAPLAALRDNLVKMLMEA